MQDDIIVNTKQANRSNDEIQWKDDGELFAIMREYLYSAVIGDILDKLGLLHQFLPAQIRPLRDDMIIVGRAMTVLEANVSGEVQAGGVNSILQKPFGLMMEALDSLKENEVYICTGASPTYALTGELMCTRARYCKAAGMVVDGYARDTKQILEMGYPVFSYGSYAQDQGPRGKVIDYRIPINIGPVKILPGDIVFGDLDGVVIVPKSCEKEVIIRAYKKATGEKVVSREIQKGMLAEDAFAKYGIL